MCSNASKKLKKNLKKKLNTTLVLTILDPVQKYKMYCGAFKKGLMCVLMRREKVTAYVSRKFKTHKINYYTHNLELDDISFALTV